MATYAQVLSSLSKRGWVSVNQFAVLIGVSYPTILRMRDRGDFKSIQIGGVYRVYQDEVSRFLEKGSRKVEGEQSPSTSSTLPSP